MAAAETGAAELDAVKARVRATYNAAASHFDAPPLAFWDRFGRRTVALAGVGAGDRVLDVCCGTGSSALPAAEAVGAGGEVVGVDFAEELLALARAKAAALGLAHARFRTGDMTALDFAAGSFDAVLCQFGVFFVPDMSGAVAGMWRLVRPGGTLTVTTWGTQVFEPASSIFMAGVARRRPDLAGLPAWQRISAPEALRGLLAAGGVAGPAQVTVETDFQPLAEPDDFWTVILGTGYRAMLEALPAAEAASLRAEFDAEVRARAATGLASEVMYAVARRAV